MQQRGAHPPQHALTTLFPPLSTNPSKQQTTTQPIPPYDSSVPLHHQLGILDLALPILSSPPTLFREVGFICMCCVVIFPQHLLRRLTKTSHQQNLRPKGDSIWFLVDLEPLAFEDFGALSHTKVWRRSLEMACQQRTSFRCKRNKGIYYWKFRCNQEGGGRNGNDTRVASTARCNRGELS